MERSSRRGGTAVVVAVVLAASGCDNDPAPQDVGAQRPPSGPSLQVELRVDTAYIEGGFTVISVRDAKPQVEVARSYTRVRLDGWSVADMGGIPAGSHEVTIWTEPCEDEDCLGNARRLAALLPNEVSCTTVIDGGDLPSRLIYLEGKLSPRDPLTTCRIDVTQS